MKRLRGREGSRPHRRLPHLDVGEGHQNRFLVPDLRPWHSRSCCHMVYRMQHVSSYRMQKQRGHSVFDPAEFRAYLAERLGKPESEMAIPEDLVFTYHPRIFRAAVTQSTSQRRHVISNLDSNMRETLGPNTLSYFYGGKYIDNDIVT